MSTSLPQMTCTECGKSMIAMWEKAHPHYLMGWACDCANTEKAILREKKFNKVEHGSQTRTL